MRCLAWIHARPRTKAQTKTKHLPDDLPATRMQAHLDSHQPIPLPPAGAAEHLVGYLMEAGPVAHGPMGAAPLGWVDLQAWQGATGIELTAWEARTLRSLSAEYLVTSQQAESPTCPAPWMPPQQLDTDSRAAIAQRVRNVMRG